MLIGHVPASPQPADSEPVREFKIDTYEWPDFSPDLGSDFPYVHLGTLVCRGTDDEFRALVEKFSVDDAILVMDADRIEEALSDLVAPTKGNPELARELRERNIPFEELLYVYTTERGHRFLNSPEAIRSVKGQRALDTAEYRAMPAGRRLRQTLVSNGADETAGLHTGVRYGAIRLADIKAIGDEEVHADSHTFNYILRGMVRGEGQATAAEIGALVAGMMDLHPADRSEGPLMKARIAHRHGVGVARNVNPEVAFKIWNETTALDREEGTSLILFYDQLIGLGPTDPVQFPTSEPPVQPSDAVLMWRSGVPAAEARQKLAEGMSALQISAVHDGVASSLSDGWL